MTFDASAIISHEQIQFTSQNLLYLSLVCCFFQKIPFACGSPWFDTNILLDAKPNSLILPHISSNYTYQVEPGDDIHIKCDTIRIDGMSSE